MTSSKGLIASCSRLVHRHFIWFLLGSYAAAALCPTVGLWIREVSLADISLFGEKTSITLPMVMLALLLVNAGLWVDVYRLKHLMQAPAVLLAGLGANLVVPVVYIFGMIQVLSLWHDPAEVQTILLGLALVAAMPIAGSSTAWSQIADGDLSLSLGLVVFSTLLSPLTTPIVLDSLGLMVKGDSAEELHQLAGGGTGLFLILCVAIPSLAGICGRRLICGIRIDSAKSPLKLFNSLNLLFLNYSNASLSLPQVLTQPDVDFLVLSLAIVVGLCAGAFASGWLIARLARVDRAQQSALVFGLGMNNNGTGLVLASLALAEYPPVMLPIILYNLLQHLFAGVATYLLDRTRKHPTPLEPAEVSRNLWQAQLSGTPSEEGSRCGY